MCPHIFVCLLGVWQALFSSENERRCHKRGRMSGSTPVQRQGPYIVFTVTVWLFYALPFSLTKKKGGSVYWQDFRVNEVTTEIIVLHKHGTLLNVLELLGLNSILLIVDTSTK